MQFLAVRDDVGRVLSLDEEKRLWKACSESRSRSLLPAVTLALNTGLRYSELRLLRWEQLDFERRSLTVGKSKTPSGDGRSLPLNDRAMAMLRFWADHFPQREPAHFVFPTERYGAGGNGFRPCVYDTDPSRPIRKLPRQVDTSKGDCVTVLGLGRNMRGGTRPRLTWGRSWL